LYEKYKSLDHIEVTTPPAKKSYTAGEDFNPSGMAVTAYYTDDTSEEVTGYTYSPDGVLELTDTQVTMHFLGESAAQPLDVAPLGSTT
jgi:hypothetical protein